MECRAIVGMYDTADRGDVDFVHGDVAGTLHLAPRTGQAKATTALAVMSHPRLVAALEQGRLGGGQAMALLAEISHLGGPIPRAGARHRARRRGGAGRGHAG